MGYHSTCLIFIVMVSSTYGAACILEFGRRTICPYEARAFHCSSVNSLTIGWRVIEEENEITAAFRPSDWPNVNFSGTSNAMAYLESRNTPPLSNLGNRTSILRYTPDLNSVANVSIICFSGTAECGKIDLIVYGRDGIDMPLNVSFDVNEYVIIYKWDHPMMNLVSHYILTIDAPGMEGQLKQVSDMELCIPYRRDGNFTYNGSVRAVSICGHESEALNFNGPMRMATPTPRTTESPGVSTGSDADLINGLIAVIVVLLLAVIILLAVVVVLLCIRGCKKAEQTQGL